MVGCVDTSTSRRRLDFVQVLDLSAMVETGTCLAISTNRRLQQVFDEIDRIRRRRIGTARHECVRRPCTPSRRTVGHDRSRGAVGAQHDALRIGQRSADGTGSGEPGAAAAGHHQRLSVVLDPADAPTDFVPTMSLVFTGRAPAPVDSDAPVPPNGATDSAPGSNIVFAELATAPVAAGAATVFVAASVGVTPAAIPEPGTSALLGLGLVGFALARRSRGVAL
jgi:hypothetical protein